MNSQTHQICLQQPSKTSVAAACSLAQVEFSQTQVPSPLASFAAPPNDMLSLEENLLEDRHREELSEDVTAADQGTTDYDTPTMGSEGIDPSTGDEGTDENKGAAALLELC